MLYGFCCRNTSSRKYECIECTDVKCSAGHSMLSEWENVDGRDHFHRVRIPVRFLDVWLLLLAKSAILLLTAHTQREHFGIEGEVRSFDYGCLQDNGGKGMDCGERFVRSSFKLLGFQSDLEIK